MIQMRARERVSWTIVGVLTAALAALQILAFERISEMQHAQLSYLYDHAERLRALEALSTVCECLQQ